MKLPGENTGETLQYAKKGKVVFAKQDPQNIGNKSPN